MFFLAKIALINAAVGMLLGALTYQRGLMPDGPPAALGFVIFLQPCLAAGWAALALGLARRDQIYRGTLSAGVAAIIAAAVSLVLLSRPVRFGYDFPAVSLFLALTAGVGGCLAAHFRLLTKWGVATPLLLSVPLAFLGPVIAFWLTPVLVVFPLSAGVVVHAGDSSYSRWKMLGLLIAGLVIVPAALYVGSFLGWEAAASLTRWGLLPTTPSNDPWDFRRTPTATPALSGS